MLVEAGQGVGSSGREVLRLTAHLACPQDQHGWSHCAGALTRPSLEGAGRPPDIITEGDTGGSGVWAAGQPWCMWNDTKMPRWQTLFRGDPVQAS